MAKANILKKKRDKNYSKLYLEVINDRNDLSWKAKGLHTYLITRPDDWKFYYSDLIARSTDGKTAVRNGIEELKEAGYLRIEERKDEKGRFTSIWTVAENPDMLAD